MGAGIVPKMVVPPRNPACREFRSGTFVFLHHLLLALALLHHLRLSCYITCIGLAYITCLKTVKTSGAETQIQEIR